MSNLTTKKPYFKRGPFKKEHEHKINEEITHPQIRITYDESLGENLQSAIVSNEEARKIADDLRVDLVEIAANANPPVCKVIEYSKHVYQLKKKKEKGTSSQVKEIKISANIAENDMNVKVKKAIEFLQDGDKVKLILEFKGGREFYVLKQQGEVKLLQFVTKLEDYGKAESLPKLEADKRKKILVMIAPKAKK